MIFIFWHIGTYHWGLQQIRFSTILNIDLSSSGIFWPSVMFPSILQGSTIQEKIKVMVILFPFLVMSFCVHCCSHWTFLFSVISSVNIKFYQICMNQRPNWSQNHIFSLWRPLVSCASIAGFVTPYRSLMLATAGTQFQFMSHWWISRRFRWLFWGNI